jgi:hypothetical protein
VLALLGGAATVGCLGGDQHYWNDPPSFDSTGLSSVTEQSVPARPTQIPVSATPLREPFETRIRTLLAPIPEPLTEGIIPNGAIREQIVEARTAARSEQQRAQSEETTLRTVEAYATAREHAAVAFGTWAAVSVHSEATDLVATESAISRRVDGLGDALPDVAPSPEIGAVVYGPIEWWLAEASRRTLVGSKPLSIQPSPLRVGRKAGEIERIAGHVQAGRFLQESYVKTLEDADSSSGAASGSIESALSTALDRLGPVMEERFRELHQDDEERPLSYPDLDHYLGENVERGRPSVELLTDELGALVDEVRFGPIAWPEYEPEHPALALRKSHWALTMLNGIDRLRERVDEGEDLFPEDGATIRTAREAAITGVGELSESDSPLEQWIAYRLVSAFTEPDEPFTGVQSTVLDERELRRAVEAYTDYVWIELLARVVDDATATVREKLPSA